MPVLFKRSELRGLHFKDARIELVLAESGTHDDECGIRDGYLFDIYTLDSREHAGYVSLRIGESPALYYLGHIGYRVFERHRGNGYAARAVRLMMPLLRKRNLRSVVITTNPDNAPSRATCEKLGCTLENTVQVPLRFRGLCLGAAEKCRYILLTEEDAQEAASA